MKKGILAAVIFAILAGGFILIKNKKTSIANAPIAKEKKIGVSIITPEVGKLRGEREFLAEIDTKERGSIGTKVSAYVVDFLPEGSKVKSGDVLLRLDSKELEDSIKAMEQNLISLSKTTEAQKITTEVQESEAAFFQNRRARDEKLFKIGAISKEHLEKIELEEKQATSKMVSASLLLEAKMGELAALKKNLEAKKGELKYFTITAPIKGVVDRVFIEKGEMSTPAKPLVQIVGASRVARFTTQVDFPISIGSEIKIGEVNGTITTVFESTKGHLKECEATIGEDFKVGELKKVTVFSEEKSGYILPCEVILEEKGGSYIYSFKEGSFKKESITLLAKNNQQCLIAENITSIAKAHPSTLAKLPAYKNIEISQ